MQYCPYIGEFVNSSFSPEHIFPLALGGSNEFVTPVSASINNQLGTSIDQPFMNETSMIKAFRVWYGLSGHHPIEPELKLKTKAKVVLRSNSGSKIAEDIDVILTLKKNGIAAYSPIFQTKVGALRFIGGSDQKQIANVLKKVAERAAERNLQIETAEQHIIDVPMPALFDVGGRTTIVFRFLAKVAVGAAHFMFKDSLTNSAALDQLRKIIHTEKDEDITLTADLIQAFYSNDPARMLGIEELYPRCHTVWIETSGLGTHAYISIFGVIAAKVLLAPPHTLFLIPPDRIFAVPFTGGPIQSANGQQKLAIRGYQSADAFYSRYIMKNWFISDKR